MLNRREVIATAAATAIVACTPVLAVAKTTPTDEIAISWRSRIDEIIATLHRLGFDHNQTVNAFQLCCYAPRTDLELADMVAVIGLTHGQQEMRERMHLLYEIGRGLERNYPGRTDSQVQWLSRKEMIIGYNGMDFLRTGAISDLQIVSFYVNGIF